MAKVLIHSNAPWVPSGYGKQTAHLVRVLQELGHEVVVSCFSGLTGAPIEWNGALVLPSGMFEYGVDVLLPHMEHVQPDLTVALMDVWKLGPLADALLAQPRPVAAWVPVDCTPLSRLDEAFFKTSNVKPIAMSRFGEAQLKNAGLDPLYAPHVVDRQVFKPLTAEDRTKYREAMGVDDRFVIGLCAANNDSTRKGFPEQFEAFRKFHQEHPDAMLWVHSIGKSARGLDLPRLALEMGIEPTSVRISDTYPQVAGMFDDSLMADWYGMLDVLSSCSYAEAFGVPMVEAQACGTPVIATAGSAMREQTLTRWSVQGQPYWNHVHGAWWTRPDVDAIVRAYKNARLHAKNYRDKARDRSGEYDVLDAGRYWRDIVEALCA